MATRKTKITIAAVVGGILILLVIAFLFAENWARQQITAYATNSVQTALSLDADTPVDVDIAGLSVIAQAITGSLDEVDVAVSDVTVGDLSGDIALQVTDIPLDSTKPIGSATANLAVDEASVQQLVSQFGPGVADSVELDGSEIQFSTQLKIFGFSFDLGVSVEPFATGGEIGFTPTEIDLNGTTISVDELKERFGGVADAILDARSVCVAQWLPADLTLETVSVDDNQLKVTLVANDVILNEEALSTLGSCDAS